MSHIAIVMLNEHGHLLPTFKLAKSLKARGHRVSYFAADPEASYVTAQGLDCPPELREMALMLKLNFVSPAFAKLLLDSQHEILELCRSSKVDLLLVDANMPVIGLIASQGGVPTVMLCANLDIFSQPWLEFTLRSAGIERIPLLKAPELVLCPKEFEFPRSLTTADGSEDQMRARYYIDSVDSGRTDSLFNQDQFDPDKPLIHCTLGSQHYVRSLEKKRFYEMALTVMEQKPDWQMSLVIGPNISPADFTSVPDNVLMVEWAPQMTILKRASIMITHGGLGTVKECIISGVPMIVFPLAHDQFRNAARIVYHGLGVRGDINQITAERLLTLIEQIESDESYMKRAGDMKEKFLKLEESQRGAKIVEKILCTLQKRSLNQSA